MGMIQAAHHFNFLHNNMLLPFERALLDDFDSHRLCSVVRQCAYSGANDAIRSLAYRFSKCILLFLYIAGRLFI